MEKVAVYASFKKQNRQSIDFFLKQLADWCLMKNYDYTIYFDKVQDRTSLKNRKELEDLKEDIEQQRYSKVVIRNISQLSRSVEDNIDFFNFLISNNCEIESMDGLDLTLYKRITEKFNEKKEEKVR